MRLRTGNVFQEEESDLLVETQGWYIVADHMQVYLHKTCAHTIIDSVQSYTPICAQGHSYRSTVFV